MAANVSVAGWHGYGPGGDRGNCIAAATAGLAWRHGLSRPGAGDCRRGRLGRMVDPVTEPRTQRCGAQTTPATGKDASLSLTLVFDATGCASEWSKSLWLRPHLRGQLVEPCSSRFAGTRHVMPAIQARGLDLLGYPSQLRRSRSGRARRSLIVLQTLRVPNTQVRRGGRLPTQCDTSGR